jgi:peptidyl-prolyl cis-trans isomerase A (cyclophilin A)
MTRRFFALLLLTVAACGSPEPAVRGPDTDPKDGAAKPKHEGPNPVVLIKTSKGDIKVELFADKSPITAENFLKYVDDQHYDGLIFHRVIKDFMIQGGGFKKGFARAKSLDDVDALKAQKDGKGIRNEAKANGLSNSRGTIAMARTGAPHSATDQFFINVVDNGYRLDPDNSDGHGYAVFGKVIDGMDVVDKIRDVRTKTLPIVQGGRPIFSDVPVEEVVIESIRREEKK